MPTQLKRLFILGVILVSVFVLLKFLLTPSSFGKYGHYRADALDEIAVYPVKYMGSKTCVKCHDTVVSMKNEGYHSDIECENCHGPAYLHNKKPKTAKLARPDSPEFCARCHSINIARPEKAVTVQNFRKHNPGKKCVTCHNPHEP